MTIKVGDAVTFKLSREMRGEVEGINGSVAAIRTWETTDDPDGQLVTVGLSKVWKD